MAEQEAQGGKFLPAFFVEPVSLNDQFAKGELPLHMTYFPPISASFTPQHAEQLRRYVNPMEPFMATVGESAYFGPENDIHVKLMERSDRLLAVHRKILSVFQYLPHSTQYRMPYNPHVSIAEGDTRVETGDSIEIGGFSIVEKPYLSETWRVIAKIGLKGSDMTTDAQLIKNTTRNV